MESRPQTTSTEMENLGFRSTLFHDWPLEKCAKTLSEVGYKSLELCLKHSDMGPDSLTPEGVDRIKQMLDKIGLRISSVYHCVESEDFIADFEDQKKCLEMAKQLDCKILVLRTAPEEADPDGRKTTRNIVELLQHAESMEMTIAIEPEPGTVLNGLYEFSRLVAETAGLPIALNLNFGHAALTEGDVGAVIHEWATFIVQANLADVRRPDHVHLLPGDGYLNLYELVLLLRDCRYEGDLILDLSGTDEAPDRLAEVAMERCKEIFV